MPLSQKHAYPIVKFSGDYKDRVRRLYQRIVNHTIRQYYLQFNSAPPGLIKDPFLEPITFEVMPDIPQPSKEWVGDIAGLADHNGVEIELDKSPNIWTVNKDAELIGHELGHTYTARVLSGLPYKSGQVGNFSYGQYMVNYIHLAQGLLKFNKDSRYVKRKLIPCPPYVGGIFVVKLAIFDIVGMLQDRQQVDAEIKRIDAEDKTNKWRLMRHVT